MAKFWDDFKAFAIKGNVIDMAVGVVIGGAFGKIVTSFVNDIIMPLIGWLVGGVNLSALKVELKGTLASGVADTVSNVAGKGSDVIEKVVVNDVPSVYLCYGNFLQEILDFFIIAFCIFLCIRLISKASAKLHKKEEAPAEAPAEPAVPEKPADVALLEEIRDLLKEKK